MERQRQIMKHCMFCGDELKMRYLESEGKEIPYCETCGDFRFPMFNVAISTEIFAPSRDKILLTKQHGKDEYILVAGFVNKGEAAENALVREVKEETGLDVIDFTFNKTEYFERSNTLMVNFACCVSSDDISHLNSDEIDSAVWFTPEQAKDKILHGSLAEKFLNAAIDKKLMQK